MSTSVEPTATPAHARGRLGWPAPELAQRALEVRRDIVTLLIDAQSGQRDAASTTSG